MVKNAQCKVFQPRRKAMYVLCTFATIKRLTQLTPYWRKYLYVSNCSVVKLSQ